MGKTTVLFMLSGRRNISTLGNPYSNIDMLKKRLLIIQES